MLADDQTAWMAGWMEEFVFACLQLQCNIPLACGLRHCDLTRDEGLPNAGELLCSFRRCICFLGHQIEYESLFRPRMYMHTRRVVPPGWTCVLISTMLDGVNAKRKQEELNQATAVTPHEISRWQRPMCSHLTCV